MYVYFIRTKAKPSMLKIGKACDIARRIHELQTGCPYELELLGSIKCRSDMHAAGIEKSLHLKFRHSRRRSEWFHLTRQMQFVIDRLAGSPCDRVTETVIEAWRDYREVARTGVREIPAGSTGPRCDESGPGVPEVGRGVVPCS